MRVEVDSKCLKNLIQHIVVSYGIDSVAVRAVGPKAVVDWLEDLLRDLRYKLDNNTQMWVHEDHDARGIPQKLGLSYGKLRAGLLRRDEHAKELRRALQVMLSSVEEPEEPE